MNGVSGAETEYQRLTKYLAINILETAALWKPGDKCLFSFRKWRLTLSREEEWSHPFEFALNGFKDNSKEIWSRRYETAEQALLHIFNHFNENAAVKNTFTSLSEVPDTIFRQ